MAYEIVMHELAIKELEGLRILGERRIVGATISPPTDSVWIYWHPILSMLFVSGNFASAIIRQCRDAETMQDPNCDKLWCRPASMDRLRRM